MGQDDDGSGDVPITIAELKAGDVFLYHRDSLLGWIISKIDNSCVGHAAIFLADGNVAEAIGPGLTTRTVKESLGNHPKDYIYVRRRKERVPGETLEPVLATARTLVDTHAPYAFDELVLLAVLGLTRKYALTPALRVAMRKVFDRAASVLLDAVHRNGPKSFICSAFVYRCFADALDVDNQHAYQIQIATHLRARAGGVERGSPLDQARERWDEEPAPATRGTGTRGGSPPWTDPPAVTDADLEAALQDALASPDAGGDSTRGGAPIDDALLTSMKRVVWAFAQQDQAQGDTRGPTRGAPELPSWDRSVEIVSRFVTPGDLYKSDSLSSKGRLKLES